MKRLVLFVASVFALISCVSEDCSDIVENFVLVESGTFTLGHEDLNEYRPTISLSDYYISKFETTVSEWEKFLEGGEVDFSWETKYTNYRELCPYPDSAIQGVSWRNATLYANWMSQKYGLEEVYEERDGEVYWNREKKGFRLPTDAEWEFAARGGNLSKGFQYSGSDDLDEVAWWWGNSDGICHPVGTKKPNELGLFDMSGNASEHCWDLDVQSSYEKNTVQIDPIGPSFSEYDSIESRRWRIERGGTEGTDDFFQLTPFERSGGLEEAKYPATGLRLVLDKEAMAELKSK